MAAIMQLDKCRYPKTETIVNGTDVLENGAFVALGAMQNTGLGRNVYSIAKLTEGCELAILYDGSIPYDESKTERDFTLAAGKNSRVYRIESVEGATISEAHVDGTVAVGDLLEVMPNSYKLRKKTTGATVGKVVEKYNYEGQASLYIEY